MKLKDFLERGIKVAGSTKELGLLLGLSAQYITEAKGERRGLPSHAAAKLARLIGEDEITVIAASELVTEKKEEVRNFWLPFVEHARAAAVALTLASVTNIVTAPNNAYANQVDNLSDSHVIQIMRITRAAFHSNIGLAKSTSRELSK